MRTWRSIRGQLMQLHPAARPTLQRRPHANAVTATCRALYDSTYAAAPRDRPVQNTSVINKAPLQLSQQLYTYLLQHNREPEVLQRLREETAAMSGSQMQITPEQGAFMAMLVELLGARTVVEVGVYTGYSSLAMALALPDDGRLYAFDRDEHSMGVARRYWELAGVQHKVQEQLAPALESLQALLASLGPASVDLAFVDADKRGYDMYYELLLQLVRPGGLILVDNVLWYGKVADQQVQDKQTQALRQLNAKLVQDPRISFSLLPVGDGMAMCRKR